jgi:DNA-binding response OmpR family regulator
VTDVLARVLVVDDSEATRRLISVNLELEGFEVFTAVDGQDCLEKIHEAEPDVVTLDIVMPRLGGMRTAEQLREDPRTRSVKIVMVTAAAQDRDRARGRRAGVDAYVTKPFDPSVLVATVRSVLGLPAAWS